MKLYLVRTQKVDKDRNYIFQFYDFHSKRYVDEPTAFCCGSKHAAKWRRSYINHTNMHLNPILIELTSIYPEVISLLTKKSNVFLKHDSINIIND